MNYQKELDDLIKKVDPAISKNPPKKLLIHSCCAPCSSYVIEYLSQYFEVTIFYYNPNISEKSEYEKRALEQQRLISEMQTRYPVLFLEGHYNPKEFYQVTNGLEDCREGGARCTACYELRLREAARIAKEMSFNFFTTTLTISPLKNADKLNVIGQKIAEEVEVSYLPSDFKKRNGYKRSIELSKEFNLYRQDYCGCIYSKMQRETGNSKDTERISI